MVLTESYRRILRKAGGKILPVFLILFLAFACGCREISDPQMAHTRFDNAERLFLNDSAESALNGLLPLLDYAEGANDTVLSARIHELMADIYRSRHNLRGARQHRLRAVEAYRLAGRIENEFYSLMDLAGEFSHEDNDSALVVMSAASEIASGCGEELRMHYALMACDIFRIKGKYADALASFRLIGPEWKKQLLNDNDSVSIGSVYHHNEMADSAALFFRGASIENPVYLDYLVDVCEEKGDAQGTIRYLSALREVENDLAGASLSNDLEFTERAYYERKAVREAGARRRVVNLAVALSLVVLLIAAVVLLIRYRRKSHVLKVENEILDAAIISQDNEDIHEETQHNDPPKVEENEKWANVIMNYYMTRLNTIGREYFRATDEKSLEKIRREFSRELGELRYSDIFSEIERHINEREEGLAKKIRRDFPKFNEQYIRLMFCQLSGLSSQSACLLLSIEKGNYYVMWSRIRARIKASSLPDKAYYESVFCHK